MEVEITSASRQKQRLTDNAVPLSIITAEDNQYSGLTNLYEILQFAPSIDSIQPDRNRYALGVRGLHDTWSTGGARRTGSSWKAGPTANGIQKRTWTGRPGSAPGIPWDRIIVTRHGIILHDASPGAYPCGFVRGSTG